MMRTRERLDRIEERLGEIVDMLYGEEGPRMFIDWGYVPQKKYARLSRVEKQVGLLLDHLGLEVKKVPATHEYCRLQKKVAWGVGGPEESEPEAE